MRLSDIIVEVRDPRYQRVGQILPQDLDLSATVLFNSVGEWSLSLAKDHHLVPTLRTPGSGIIITGLDGTVLLSGPVTSPQYAATPEDTEGTINFDGVTDDVILQDRLAYPDPAQPDVTKQSVAHDNRAGKAETLAHDYVNVNVGPLAVSERKHPYLTMGDNLNRGPDVTKQARFPILGALLTEIFADTALGFRIRQGGGSNLIFDTFEAVDRSAFIRLSIKNDGLAGLKTTVQAPTFTRAILGGQGEQEDRLFYEASNVLSLDAESLWGRRIEKFVNASSGGGGENQSEIEQQGKEALEDGAFTTTTIEMIPAEDATLVFGRDWGLGDKVTVELDNGYTVPGWVNGYAFTASASEGFIFGVVLSDGLAQNTTHEQELEARVSYLERNEVVATPDSTGSGVTFSFATPINTWNCPHNLGQAQVLVTTFDMNGREVVGDVQYVDANNVRVTWYYPTSGSVRISR